MKKYILAAMLTLVAGTAFAGEYVGATVGSTQTTAGQRSNVVVATYGQKFDQVSVEGRVAAVQGASVHGLTDFVEARARYDFSDVAGFTPWVRATLGDQIRSTVGSRAYVAVEPGVGYQISDALRADASVARTVTTGRSVGAHQTSYTVGASYAFSAKNSLGVDYTHVIGNEGSVSMTGKDAVLVSFNHSL